MDILDILIAKKQSSDAQADAAVRKAQEAVQKANQVTAKIDAAQELLATAETAISELNAAKEDLGNIDATIENKVRTINDEEYMPDINTQLNDLDSRMDTLEVDFNTLSDSITEPTILYTTTGQHTDGTMTQKAITDALNAIPQGGGGDGTSQTFPPEAVGQLITVGEDSTAEPSTVAEADMVELLIKSSSYNNPDAVGIEIDYENRTVKRTQAAAAVTTSTDIPTFFNNFKMYGGMKRCVVADNGEIVAFEGDSNYIEDGSLGQVMVYIPAFYYKRTPIKITDSVIKKESIIISAETFPGAVLHPFFATTTQQAVPYGLFSAYEGSIYRTSSNAYDTLDTANVDFNADKLSSLANVKPISGAKNALTLNNAAKLATNRGSNWDITTAMAESAVQMLMIIEYGTLNMQTAIEAGVCNITSVSDVNCAALTGSTSTLGSKTGAATTSIVEISGNQTTYSEAGRRSISYRGIENPWGNLFRLVKGLEVTGNGSSRGGRINGAMLPASSNFISGFCLIAAPNDYLFIPGEASGSSAGPVGDYVWVSSNLNGTNVGLLGGRNSTGERNGPFCYGFDSSFNSYAHGVGARMISIAVPAKISANETKWSQAMTKAYGTINWL